MDLREERQIWKERIEEVCRTERAFELLKTRYFDPFADVVGLRGNDEIGQRFADVGGEKVLDGLEFPTKFEATRSGTDVQATQHEMGHFVSISERRCVMAGFGFGGGVPDLNFQPWKRMHTGPVSGIVEAKAIAWELILLRDLHGLEPPTRVLVDSLRYASDFYLYPGGNDEGRYDWVADKVDGFARDFEDVARFDRLWHERCSKLPELLAVERIRANLHTVPPIYVEKHEAFIEGWDATIEQRVLDGIEEVSVTLDDGEDATYETFATIEAAQNWVAEVRSCYVEDEPQPERTASMRM